MDGKDQSHLNNHELNSGNDECNTDDEFHSDNDSSAPKGRQKDLQEIQTPRRCELLVLTCLFNICILTD